jgi:hypothetical protein
MLYFSGVVLDLDKQIFPWQMFFLGGGGGLVSLYIRFVLQSGTYGTSEFCCFHLPSGQEMKFVHEDSNSRM